MRLAIIGAGLLVAGCAGAPTADNTQPANRVCGLDDCFYERDVRNFEVIEHTTLIVYVGNQLCPYQIELHGTFCDLQLAPEIYFISPTEGVRDTNQNVFGGSDTAGLRDLKICKNELNIGVSGGVITENPTSTQPPSRYGGQRSNCQISSVASLTDDQLIELYVRRGVVAPPPPMGSGKIEVGEQKSTEPPSPSSETQAGTQPAGTTEEGGAPSRSEDAATAAAAAPR